PPPPDRRPAAGRRDLSARPAQRPELASRVQPVVRWALYAYICSIPFEMPQRSIPIEIPTLFGCVFLLATLLDRRTAYARFPAALGAFVVYLWLFAAAALANLASHQDVVLKFFLEMVQLLLLFWAIANLLMDEPVRVGALRALALACGLRAALQLLGVATSERVLWTGGERITTFGQNANLAALILSAGLLAALALPSRRDPSRRWPLVLRWPLVVIIGIAIVQTSSRGGLLALAIGLATFVVRGPTPWARLRNTMTAFAVLGMLGFAASRSEGLRNRFTVTAATGSLAGRERIYPEALVMLRERPLLGWGPIENQYELERRLQDPGYIKRDAHNLVLELLTSTGFAGTVPFLVGLVLCLGAALRARRTTRGVLPFAMLLTILTGTMSGTWIASKILWFVLAQGDAAGRGPALAGRGSA
ncbi:MAG TPA: O-antigen ligase family protein, partial [Gemmatimonadales bacterium]|nr:O-antigen ligase family protein [Gemmatimonadales bacterium]